MKKLLSLLLALAMIFCLLACGEITVNVNGDKDPTTAPTTEPEGTDPTEPSTNNNNNNDNIDRTGVLSYAEYMAAEIDDEVTIMCYVQDKQGWWANKITVYGADQDGAYYLYNMACSEADAAKLVPGTLIKVTGYKAEWEGEIEIAEGATFEFVEGATPYIAPSKDLTDKLGTDEIINYQNQKVSFSGMTVKSITYRNNGGDDIYLTLSKDGKDYDFCVEVYLTGTDSEVYTTVGTLAVGDVVNVSCFLYWYQGMNPHVTAIAKAA